MKRMIFSLAVIQIFIIFTLNYVLEKQHWRCVQAGCPGRLHSTGEGEELKVIHFREHNHMPDEEKVASIRVKAKLCDMARAEPLKSL